MPPSVTISKTASALPMPRWGSAACALFTMTATGLSPAASPSASASPVMRLISGAGPSGISGLAPGAEAEDALCVPDEVLSPHAVMPNASITASAKKRSCVSRASTPFRC